MLLNDLNNKLMRLAALVMGLRCSSLHHPAPGVAIITLMDQGKGINFNEAG